MKKIKVHFWTGLVWSILLFVLSFLLFFSFSYMGVRDARVEKMVRDNYALLIIGHRQLDPANLYRVLRRMKREGWIREVEGGGASPGEANARRRAYSITPTGRSLLASELARLERLLEQVRPTLAQARGR